MELVPVDEHFLLPRSSSLIYYVRLFLVVVLVTLFLWQTYFSLKKFLKRDVTTTFKVATDSLLGLSVDRAIWLLNAFFLIFHQTLYPEKQTFPSISFCGTTHEEEGDGANDHYLNWTFQV